MDWNTFFFKMCDLVSEKSKDKSTQVGCVIVGPNHEIRSIGYNGFPRGVTDDVPVRQERPMKYFYSEHGERNAIYNAARVGIPLAGCILYIGGVPCADCARAIIQSGIAEIFIRDGRVPERWKDSCDAALVMLDEAGVQCHIVGMEGKGYGSE